jgi:hypothetical protein
VTHPTTHHTFSAYSWHDCQIWGFEIVAGSPEDDDWTSDLVFDIDYIVAWTCRADGSAEFRVAPATLVFHGVTAPRIAIEFDDPTMQIAVSPLAIHMIEREQVADQKAHLDRPYYRWSIRLNWPSNGEISFGAWGFTQTLRGEPVLLNGRQNLTLAERGGMRPRMTLAKEPPMPGS